MEWFDENLETSVILGTSYNKDVPRTVYLTFLVFSQVNMVPRDLVEQALACQAKYAGCLGTVAACLLQGLNNHLLLDSLRDLL